MKSNLRKYLFLLLSVCAYYGVHEGAHLLYALITGVFKGINFLGLGIQIDIFAEGLSDIQLAVFCLVGPLATLFVSYIMVLRARFICLSPSKIFKAGCFYITTSMLLIDPIYLSILCGFVGGGDMNGIALIIPEIAARLISGVIMIINVSILITQVYPVYKNAFADLVW